MNSASDSLLRRTAAAARLPSGLSSGLSSGLRLVPAPEDAAAPAVSSAPGRTSGPPARLSEAADPRWVLAVRTAEALEGTVIVPEKRERLLAVGAAVGLSPFDTALVIAMVQDQARRGVPARQCPAAAEPQLRHVPRPAIRAIPWRTVAAVSVVVVALEVAVVASWMMG